MTTRPHPVRLRLGWLFLVGPLVTYGALSAGLAWACVPQARLVTVQPRSSGPPGTVVSVSGLGLDPVRAEVRWNASDGELLGTADGPDFSLDVTIPDVDSGLYHLIVVSRAPGGEVGSTAAAAFQVSGPGASPSAPQETPPSPTSGGVRAAPLAGGMVLTGGMVLAGGAALVGLGFVGGILLSRRRRSGTSPETPPESVR